MAEDSIAAACRWCGRACRPRRGGSPQVFCAPACRTAFHTAARRWAEQAVASGMLTVAELRNGNPAACTLLPRAVSPAPISEPQKPAPMAPAAHPDDPAELLDELLLALLELPEDGWFKVMDMLPTEVVNKLCGRIEADTG